MRKKEDIVIPVPNVHGSKQEVQYTVYTDLDEICGKPSLNVRPGVKENYSIVACSTKSGVFHGSITFTTKKGIYIWYTIEIRVKQPEAAGLLEVSTKARSAMKIQLALNNPLEEDLTFRVVQNGHGLEGP